MAQNLEKAKRIVSTKIELDYNLMSCLKANKRINGTSIGWALQKAVEEYVEKHKLDELPKL